jgi:hypothetical protein
VQPSPPGYPPVAPPVAPARPVLRPSGWWYAVAGAIVVVGLAVAVVLVVRAVVTMTDEIDDFDRAQMPVTLQVEIDEPGGYTIYHEVENGRVSNYLRGEPSVSVTDPGGAPVVLDRYDSTVTYDFGGHDGEAVYSFRADQAGTYTVDASMSFETRAGTDVVAVGPGLGGRLVPAIVAAVVIGLLAFVGGGVLAIVVGVRRGRSRRAQMPVPPLPGFGPPPLAPGYGPPPGAPGYGPPPGGPGYGPPPAAQGYGPPPAAWNSPGPGAPPAWGAPPPAGGQAPADSGAPGAAVPQDAPPPADTPQDRV